MFHRSVFDAVDLPDERFVINGEERDLFIRVRAAGLTTATATDVVISHPSGKGAMRPGFLGPFGAPIPRSRMKLAYQLRNRAFLTRRGRRVDWLLVDSVRYSLAALAQGPHRLRRWHELVRVYATGLSGHLGTLPEETLSAWPTGPGDKDLSCVRLQSARDGLAEG
jgi:GT2 family glycosyltransferase